jgi:hypothetical protein
MMIEVDWRVTFIDSIKEHKLLPGIDKKSEEAARNLKWSKGYVLVRDNLNKCGSASGILMKGVRMEEGREILQEIHEGACGNHAGSCTLVGKAFRSCVSLHVCEPELVWAQLEFNRTTYVWPNTSFLGSCQFLVCCTPAPNTQQILWNFISIIKMNMFLVINSILF